jgi:hypothetical protein
MEGQKRGRRRGGVRRERLLLLRLELAFAGVEYQGRRTERERLTVTV